MLAEAADEIEAAATDPVSLTTGPAQPPVSDPDETAATDPDSPAAADGDAYDAVGHLRNTNPAAFAGGGPDPADPLADAVQAAAAATAPPVSDAQSWHPRSAQSRQEPHIPTGSEQAGNHSRVCERGSVRTPV